MAGVFNWLVEASDGILSALVYIVIVLVFVAGLIRCVAPVLNARGKLKRAIRNIKSGNNKRSWQEDKFLGRGMLFPHWSEYLNNLFFADGVYHNASNVEDYINEETCIYGPGRATFADAIPGLLVSIGFLGTLIGLAMGLSGFNMTDSAAVQQSIVTLVPGMRYAFMTSIAGVIGSVAFTLITRFVNGSVERTLRDFYGAMSRYAGVLSVDPMTQIAIYQQEQTALIQTMAQDLNGSFTDNITSAIRMATEPLTDAMTNFINVNTEQQMRFLDKIVTHFMDRLDDALNGQFERLSSTLSHTSDMQEEIIEAMKGSMEGAARAVNDVLAMQKLSSDMLTKFDSYIGKLDNAGEQIQEGYMQVAGAVEKIDIITRQQNAYLKSVSDMHTDLTNSFYALQQSTEAFANRMIEQSAGNTAAMLKAAGELRATGNMIGETRARVSEDMHKELSSTLDAFRDYMAEFTNRVDGMTASITQSVAGLPDAVADTGDEFLGRIDRINLTLARAQRSLDEAVDRLYNSK